MESLDDLRDPENVLLSDPLCDQSRRERLILLALSVLGIGMGWARQMPTGFSFLGFQAEHLDPTNLAILAMLAIAYLLLSFTVHASLDLLKWRKSFENAPSSVSSIRVRLVCIVAATARLLSDVVGPAVLSMISLKFLALYL